MPRCLAIPFATLLQVWRCDSGTETLPLMPLLLSREVYQGGPFFGDMDWWFMALTRSAAGAWEAAFGADGKPLMFESGPLMDQYPEPLLEIHPTLAARHGFENGDLVRVVSRRGDITLPCLVVKSIRADTVFIPYHWAGKQSANQVTVNAVDGISKIPEFKTCAVRLEKGE